MIRAVAALVMLSGCSLMFARAPVVSEGPPPKVNDCRRSYWPPIIDLGVGLGGLGLAIGGSTVAAIYPYEDAATRAALEGEPWRITPQGLRALAIAGALVGGLAVAGFFGWFGISGWSNVAECRELRRTIGLRPGAVKTEKVLRIVSSAELVAGCRRVGSVEGSSGWGGWMFSGKGLENAREEMAEEAERLGADTVLVQFQGADASGSDAVGEAYRCEGVAAPTPAPPPPPVADGCSKDTDCKGDRICVERACVDPPVSPEPAPEAEPAPTPVSPEEPSTLP